MTSGKPSEQSLSRWDDEGGSPPIVGVGARAPVERARRARAESPPPERETLLNKRDESAEACRERAAADLRESATRSTDNGRRLLESSAASWLARSRLLQRLEDKFARRKLQRPSADG